jgi:hypothetical protein
VEEVADLGEVCGVHPAQSGHVVEGPIRGEDRGDVVDLAGGRVDPVVRAETRGLEGDGSGDLAEVWRLLVSMRHTV